MDPDLHDAHFNLSRLHERQTAYSALLDGLHFADGTGIKKAVIGQGQFLMGDELPALLAAAAIRREPMVDNGLQYVRRAYAGGNYYFISNAGSNAFSGDVSLQTKAVAAILFDPMLERKGLAKIKNTGNGSTAVYLDLQPGESVLVRPFAAPS